MTHTLDKLRKAAGVDRRLTLREILEKIFGLIPRFKSKDELLEEEFSKFIADTKPEEPEALPAIKTYFKALKRVETLRLTLQPKRPDCHFCLGRIFLFTWALFWP
jgi:type I restriction enzyme R subunit